MEYTEFREIPQEVVDKATILQYYSLCETYLDEIEHLKDQSTSIKINYKLANNSQNTKIENIEDFNTHILPNDVFESFELYIGKMKNMNDAASFFFAYDSFENDIKYHKFGPCKRRLQVTCTDKVWVNEKSNQLQKWFEEVLNTKQDVTATSEIHIDKTYKLNKIGVIFTIIGTLAAIVGILIAILKQ